MEDKGLKNIFDAFDSVTKKQGQDTAVIYLGTGYSYTRVKDMAERFAAALLDIGVNYGDRIIIYIPNSIQWVVVWLGILRAGGISVPITPIYTPYDLKYIANDSGSEPGRDTLYRGNHQIPQGCPYYPRRFFDLCR